MDVRPIVEGLHHIHDDRTPRERRHLLVKEAVARVVAGDQQHLHEAVVAVGQHPSELAARAVHVALAAHLPSGGLVAVDIDAFAGGRIDELLDVIFRDFCIGK